MKMNDVFISGAHSDDQVWQRRTSIEAHRSVEWPVPERSLGLD